MGTPYKREHDYLRRFCELSVLLVTNGASLKFESVLTMNLQMLKLFLILMAALTTVACGGDDTDEIVGTWKVISLAESAIFTFVNDGRCIVSDDNDTVYGTYRVFGNLLEINFDGEITSITFSINGNLMTWEGGEIEGLIVLERV